MTKPLTIQSFCTHIAYKYLNLKNINFDYRNIGIDVLAEEFIHYFQLGYPLNFDRIWFVCFCSEIEIKTIPAQHRARGYNFTYGKKSDIFIRENDPPCARIHTVLHELYEIIDRSLCFLSYEKIVRNEKELEMLADQFSAYVHAPEKKVLDWINSKGLDVFGMKSFFDCSYATALIRMNELLCKLISKRTNLPIPVIGLLYERAYWKNTVNRNPPLKLTLCTQSSGFSFALTKPEVNGLKFISPWIGDFNVQKLIEIFSNGYNGFMPSIEMKYKNNSLTVDILIRTVHWSTNNCTMKILIQIMPADNEDLRKLAEMLVIDLFCF